MNLSDNPILRTLGTIAAIIGGLMGLGYLAVFGILIAVSLPDPSRRPILPDWTATTEVYLRNRTAAPLLVTLTVPRAAVQLDSAWWGVAIDHDAIGRGLVADSLLVPGLRYRLPAPVLVAGSADTLVVYRGANVFGAAGRRAFFNPWRDLPRWVERMERPQPAPGAAVRVQTLAKDSDSLRVVLVVAPDSALRLGYRQTEYYAQGAPPEADFYADDQNGLLYPAPAPLVQWRDARHRWHQHRPPLVRWLALAAPAGRQPADSHERRYKEYR